MSDMVTCPACGCITELASPQCPRCGIGIQKAIDAAAVASIKAKTKLRKKLATKKPERKRYGNTL